uniref:Uncharacterized protein n=1 Tax=virus sp. ctBM815 TaxID=2825806 RepID=A0A8S5RK50_9VIRU|nr:MAG TPA: hypothetical protein [virus sp. ctBM815]DAH83024.1 MAG TPA: hypothetical protein [Bacteriophage sp.]DAV23918.1 MAG TPA: hypothetical protein [Bacteriophage sp.]
MILRTRLSRFSIDTGLRMEVLLLLQPVLAM